MHVPTLAAYQLRVTHESSRESLHPCTILSISSHSLTHYPLHDFHLNIGLLITKIQANLARNKANKMIDKIQPYIDDIWNMRLGTKPCAAFLMMDTNNKYVASL